MQLLLLLHVAENAAVAALMERCRTRYTYTLTLVRTQTSSNYVADGKLLYGSESTL